VGPDIRILANVHFNNIGWIFFMTNTQIASSTTLVFKIIMIFISKCGIRLFQMSDAHLSPKSLNAFSVARDIFELWYGKISPSTPFPAFVE